MKPTQQLFAAFTTLLYFFLGIQEHRVVNADEPTIQSLADLEQLRVGLRVI